TGLAVGRGVAWVGNGDAGSVSMIDPRSSTARTISLGSERSSNGQLVPRAVGGGTPGGPSTRGAHRLPPSALPAISQSRNTGPPFGDLVPFPAGPNGLVVADGAAWFLARGLLTRVDLRRHTMTTAQVGDPLPEAFGGHSLPMGVARGSGNIWVTNPYEGLVAAVGPATGAVVNSVQVPGQPVAVATGGGTVWVVGLDGEVWRIDESTTSLLRTVRLGHSATSVAVGDGRVWVAVAGP